MLHTPRSTRRLVFSSGIVLTARCLLALGGVVAAVLIAGRFGAGQESDAYFTARLIPVVFSMSLGTAFNLAFLPVYTQTLHEQGERAAARLAGDFRNLTLGVSLAAAVAYVLLADWIVALLAPGFSADAQRLTVTLTRIMAASIVFVNLYAVMDSVLNSGHRYAVSSLASLCLPAGTLVGILVLDGVFAMQMAGVAAGVLAGAAIQFLVVTPSVRDKFHGLPSLAGLRSPQLHAVLRQFTALMFVIGASQVNLAVNRMIASLVGEGAVSAFGFAFVLIGLAPALVAMPVFKVLYPELLHFVAAGDRAALRRLFQTNLFVIAFLTFPLVMIFASFATPIVGLTFQYGQFDALAGERTADVIRYLSISLWPSVTSILVNYYFCATGRASLPARVGVVLVGVNAALAYTLMRVMDVGGIALANSLVALVNLAVMGVLLSRDLGGLGLRSLVGPLGKTAAAAVCAGLALSYSGDWLAPAVDLRTVFHKVAAYGGLVAASLGIYFAVNLLLRNRKMLELAAVIRGGLRPEAASGSELEAAAELLP